MARMRIDKIEIRDADIFEILLDSFPDMIHSIDDKGNIVYTNKTAEILLGYTGEELLGMNVRQIYADRVQAELEKGFTDLKERGDKNIPESWLKTKDGIEIPVEIRSFSIYDDEGNFLKTFSILRDIREIKDLQQSLIHAGKLAAIGELSSGIAHDINNPLTVILLSNEMLIRDLESRNLSESQPDQKIHSFATDIQRASKSIQKLADHLRNFSRGVVEKTEYLDLYDILTDALFITGNKSKTVGAVVNNNAKKGIHFTEGRPNQIEQVFVNLIGNACDAMAETENRELTISISEEKYGDNDCWKCDISDTGKGIPPELVNDIFQSFFTTKEKGKGTGLGLSISRGIIRDHKGDVEVSSERGIGTTFSIYLPKAG
ncbi:MAG: PAS domain S-box protein [Kiritimatiellae bacterium]|nr:PAS domain S-box protein [Kiritimatiellia bacterium]